MVALAVLAAHAAVGALLFGAAALLAVFFADMICARIESFADGPASLPPRPVVILTLMAVVGGFVAVHGFAASVLAVGGVAAFALTGCWYCDLARGVVPDFFTLLPLGALGAFAAVEGEWKVLISAAIPFAPFAIAALLSRGRGMGWGDAKLVALGAGVFNRMGGRRGTPIAFAPYLVVAAALALALGAYT
jgi:hypothetical protein